MPYIGWSIIILGKNLIILIFLNKSCQTSNRLKNWQYKIIRIIKKQINTRID